MKNVIKRKCRGCGETKDRALMIKITIKEGELYLNPGSKTVGRSVYVCPDINCVKNLIKTKGIKRALKFNNDAKIKEIEQKLLEFIGLN